MQFDSLYTLLQCHSIEDFPVHLAGNDAASVLANWTAPWHPTLVARSGKMPKWLRLESLSEIGSQSLILAPKHLVGSLADLDFPASATVLKSFETRAAIWSELGLSEGGCASNACCADDFAALAYAFLQVQLLTRRLRFTWGLDEPLFEATVVAAARAFSDKELNQAHQKLQLAFDQLLVERNKAYPVDGQILDLELWNSDCLGQGTLPVPKRNLLASVEELKDMQEHCPDAWRILVDSVGQGTLQVITGPRREFPEIMLSTRSAVYELITGRQTAFELLGFEPTTYGRKSGGMHPALPQWLSSLGYRAALHQAFDNTRLPPASGNTISWRGISDESIDAIAAMALDAARADGFVDWSMDLGRQLDSAHQATLVVAHATGEAGEPYRDVIRTARFNGLLGKFVTADELFDSLYHPGYGDRFDYDDYRTDWLGRWEREGRVDLISGPVDYYRAYHRWLSLRLLNATLSFHCPRTLEIDRLLGMLLESVNQWIVPPRTSERDGRQIARQALNLEFDRIEAELLRAASKMLNPGGLVGGPSAILNTCFEERRALWDYPAVKSLDSKKPVVVASPGTSGGANGATAVIDLPGNGFSVAIEESKQPLIRQPSPVFENSLRNDFFEVEIDRASGGIRSVRKHGSRNKLASQQLAILVDSIAASQSENARSGYALMVAESVELDSPNPLVGRSTARGNLVYANSCWGRFRQIVQVTRASRTIDVHVELELEKSFSGRTWEQYCCSRLAWNDDALERYRGLHETHQPLRLEKFIAPSYVQIENGYTPVSLFSRGLAFHRQSSLRILDTLLSVGEERAKSFSFSIGIGIDDPMSVARQLEQQTKAVATAFGQNLSQRFFHLSHRNVDVLDASPCDDGSGSVHGVVLWLRETVGKRGELVIHAPKVLKGVKRLDLAGRPLEGLAVHEDQVHVEYHEFQLFVIQLFW